MRIFRNIAIVLALLLLVAAGGGIWAWQRYDHFANQPITGLHAGDSVMVETGDPFAKVLRKLRAQGVQEGADLQWRLLARQLNVAAHLNVGEYALEPDTTPMDLLLAMRNGKVIQHQVTFIEGWNIRQLRAALNNATPLKHETTELDDAALMAALGHAGQHPEGRFLPETYLYTRGDSDLDVLKRAYNAMEKTLAEVWQNRADGLPLQTPDEALILASIIEKETGVADERPQIAGVFARRLNLGMLLQTDPTVIYGMGSSYDGNIRKRDLQTDTPYNTYTRVGLPPTPIAMPSKQAIEATVNPADGDTLFFVAVGDGSRRHLFARTYAEHLRNYQIYDANRRRSMQSAPDSQPSP
jgi:UPF0755 protein